MNEFKVGDEVWFFHTGYGMRSWGDNETLIYPSHLEINLGQLVYFNEKIDKAHIYVNGIENVAVLGTTFFSEWVFKTKQEAIDAMIAHIKTL